MKCVPFSEQGLILKFVVLGTGNVIFKELLLYHKCCAESCFDIRVEHK